MSAKWIDETDVRRQAWRAMITSTNVTLSTMEEELRTGAGLLLPEYDALLHVADAGDDGIRMTDLAGRVLLTKAGLTSLIDRLEGRGLVERQPDPDDRRAIRIVLTDDGWQRFRGAADLHVRSIEEHFTNWITDDEANVIVAALERARAHLES